MPSAVPAMRGQFGNTEFFLVTMHAKELSERLVIPKEMEGWDDLSLEERFQRDVNYARVKKHIAPYLASDSDRFFGAFIVAMKNHEGVEFEEIGEVVKKLPMMYRNAASPFGFLNFKGNEVLVPLDGQHRLAAIRFAISGKDEKGKDIAGLTPNHDVASDLCTVILVRYEETKARRIFNKVNRYAKATTRGENLITADDDIVAVITREDIAHEVIGSRLVRYTSNTLPAKAHEFTTLSTLYDATGMVLEETYGPKISRLSLPDANLVSLYRGIATDFWSELCGRVKVFQSALVDGEETGDEKRQEIRRDYLLGRPVVQLALVEAVLRLRGERSDGSRLSWDKVASRINDVDWSPNENIWQSVLMSGKKIVAGKTNARFAARFLAYYLGQPMSAEELKRLEEDYQSRVSEEGTPLPGRLFLPDDR